MTGPMPLFMRLHRLLSAKGQAVVRRPHAKVRFPGAAGEVLHHQVLRLQAPLGALLFTYS